MFTSLKSLSRCNFPPPFGKAPRTFMTLVSFACAVGNGASATASEPPGLSTKLRSHRVLQKVRLEEAIRETTTFRIGFRPENK